MNCTHCSYHQTIPCDQSVVCLHPDAPSTLTHICGFKVSISISKSVLHGIPSWCPLLETKLTQGFVQRSQDYNLS